MPGNPRPVVDERDALLTFLAQQRLVLTIAAHGLTDDQARATPTASTLSVGGLIKHVASVESYWIDLVLQQPAADDAADDAADEAAAGAADGAAAEDYEAGFRLGADETLAGAISAYEAVARRTEEVIAGIEDMDQPVPVPHGVPWFPQDVDAWSVRWVLLHLIQETARHAGHADMVREAVDGATAFPLMAAVEGWPSTPWLQPWEPAAAAVS